MAVLVGSRVALYRRRRAVENTPAGPQLTEPLTLQELSDRCAGLGFPVARSVLSKLEKGHRHSVTVDEVLVLAQALNVPPLLLLVPLGQHDTTEVLPGQLLEPLEAMAWFAGEAELGDPAPYAIVRGGAQPGPANDDAELFRTHRRMAQHLAGILEREKRRQRDIAAGTHTPRYVEAAGDPPPSRVIPIGESSTLRIRDAQDVPDLVVEELLRREELDFRAEAGMQAGIIRNIREQIRGRGLMPPVLPDGLEYIDHGASRAARDGEEN